MKHLEKIFNALDNRRRLAIIKYLKENHEASVSEIAKELKIPFKTTSKHLRILSAADIVDKEQRRFQVYYFISDDIKLDVKVLISVV